MMHLLLNPTWRCQNQCSYCWLNDSIRAHPELLHAQEREPQDWIAAIMRDVPDLVDVAGGEPLLLEWLPSLFGECSRTRFGLSTNGLALRALRRLCQQRPGNVVAINLSYHPETKERIADYDERWLEALRTLREANAPVHVNVVDHGDNAAASEHILAYLREENVRHEVSPYEDVTALSGLRDTGLVCKGGINHLVVAPDGEAWPCLTTLRSPYWEGTQLGNWLDGEVDMSKRIQPCHLQCHDLILKERHIAGDMWGTDPREVGEGES